MPRLSVVVPVYNVEQYLPECLDSLLIQDFDDFEVVLVNDGSPDGSKTICEHYCNLDARFCLISKENGGLSSARNKGIDAARGDYISFLDADDRYTPQACGRIVQALDESGADVLTFGGSAWPAEESYPWLEEVLSPRDCIYGTFSEDLLMKEASKPFAWRLALRRSFVEACKIRFDESVSYGEDQVFAFAVYPRSSRTCLIHDKLYDYRIVRGDSMLNRMLADKPAMLSCHIELERKIMDDWASLGILDDHCAMQLTWICEFILFDALRLSDDACAEIWQKTSRNILSQWSRDRIAKEKLTPGVRALVLAAKDNRRPTRIRRALLMCACYYDWHGIDGVMRRLLHGPRKTHS